MSIIKSAERALDVLLLLTSSDRPLSASEIARCCQMPRSSTYQLLNAMRAKQFISYYPDQRSWGLGIAAFETGSAHLRARRLEWISRAALTALAHRTREAAHLAVLDGDEVVYLAKEEPSSGCPFLITAPGIRLPAHLTAVGRVILANLPSAALEAIYPPSRPLIRRTADAVDTRSELERLLECDRERGYSIEQNSTTLGVSCIAAPIFGHSGLPTAAINVSFISAKYAASEQEALALMVTESAEALSRKLGWRHAATESLTSRWRGAQASGRPLTRRLGGCERRGGRGGQ